MKNIKTKRTIAVILAFIGDRSTLLNLAMLFAAQDRVELMEAALHEPELFLDLYYSFYEV